MSNRQRVFNTEYAAFNEAFSSSFGFSGYNPDLDIDGDGRVFNTDYRAFLASIGSLKVYSEPQS